MTQQQEAAFIRKLNTKCDELACEFFEKSDDLAAVSFALRQVIVNRWLFAQEREASDKEEVSHGRD